MAGLGGAAIQRLRADDAVRVGIIGSGGRGRYLMGEFKEIGAHVDAVCDVYEPNRNAGLKIASTGNDLNRWLTRTACWRTSPSMP